MNVKDEVQESPAITPKLAVSEINGTLGCRELMCLGSREFDPGKQEPADK